MPYQSIGNYYLEAELGNGGFGRVYKGRHSILTEREVAVKVLHSSINSAEERERFLQEAHFLEQLKHPYILHIYDVGVSEGFPYIVSAYASEGSLAELLKMCAPRPLPEDVAIGIIIQVGSALHYAHRRQVIHRDLKPENILFEQGTAYLADFGIAITLTTSSIKDVAVTGTPLYMAPEQFQGRVSKESDQYSLACIAYELVTGRKPFTAPDFFSMGFQHLSTPPTPPSHYNPDLSPHVEQAILKALAKQRTDRYPSIREFLLELNPNASSVIDPQPNPLTPAPTVFDERAGAFRTHLSSSGGYLPFAPTIQQARDTNYKTEQQNVPVDIFPNAIPFIDSSFEIPDTPFEPAKTRVPQRKLIAGIGFLLVACLVSLLLFVTLSHASNNPPSGKNAATYTPSTPATILPTNTSSHPQGTNKGSTPHTGVATRTTSSTTTGGTTSPATATASTTGTTTTPRPTATQGQSTPQPTVAPTDTPIPTPTDTPIPTPTDTPIPTPTDTPIPTPTDTPIPTPTPTP